MGLLKNRKTNSEAVQHEEQEQYLKEDEIARLEAEAVLREYDKESAYRSGLPKPLELFIGVLLVCFSLFQIYTSIITIPSQLLRCFHLTFVTVLVFLLFPAKKGTAHNRIPWYDWILAAISMSVMLYVPLNYDYVIKNMGNYGTLQTVIGILGILLVMEACRRVVGIPIMVVVGVFLLYTLFGKYVPGTFSHRGYSLARVASQMFFTTEGIFGTPIGVSATFIFLFILFGAFLEKTGVGKLFIDISNAIAGRYSGGPAKVAVISSALQGTVSGSSVANTVGTGSFTIPAMKRLGYKPEFAGAVEAAASTGGQIMPPIMGAAAFLMAEVTGFRYSDVVTAAIIPAVLYFAGILIAVHHEAKKLKLVGMPREEIPSMAMIFKERGYLLLPLIFMIFILAYGLTPTYAALGAILTAIMAYSTHMWSILPVGGMAAALMLGVEIKYCALGAIILWIVICLFRRSFGISLLELIDALKSGARGVLSVAVACAMAGMIVGSVTLTGVGMKFATGLVHFSGGNMYLMLLFTMLASLILGMGVPTTANYLITSSICAPAIISMLVSMQGLEGPTKAITMSAHLFVFYFGIIADITPPVALAAMAGSAIAKGDPFKTGVTATRIAIAAFIVPYLFVLNPAMLMIDTGVFEVIQIVITALVGIYSISGGLCGYILDNCRWYEVVLLIAGGLGMIIPGTMSDIVGLVLLIAIMLMQYKRKKRAEAVLN